METKKCYDCDQVKNIDEFEIFRTQRDGAVHRRRMCKECFENSNKKTDNRTKLRELRGDRGISQSYLSILSQVSEHKIKAFEKMELEPSVNEYKSMAKVLKVAPEYFGIVEEKPEKPNIKSLYPNAIIRGEVNKRTFQEGTYKITKSVTSKSKGFFTGRLIGETDNFIVLEDHRGIRESFLKVDFITKEISKELVI